MTVFYISGQYIFAHTKLSVYSQAKIHFQCRRQSVPVVRQCWSVHLRHDICQQIPRYINTPYKQLMKTLSSHSIINFTFGRLCLKKVQTCGHIHTLQGQWDHTVKSSSKNSAFILQISYNKKISVVVKFRYTVLYMYVYTCANTCHMSRVGAWMSGNGNEVWREWEWVGIVWK